MEHSGAAMASALAPLTAVMGIETALMAVMRLDVVALQLAALAVSASRKCVLELCIPKQEKHARSIVIHQSFTQTKNQTTQSVFLRALCRLQLHPVSV